nr:hypothetical protein [uncultured Psychrobacter sp.]
MRYLLLAVLVTGSAALTGCFGDNDNDNFDPPSQVDNDLIRDQANAQDAVNKTSAVIDASNNVNTDEPQDIDRIMLSDANRAEPIAIKDPNASL